MRFRMGRHPVVLDAARQWTQVALAGTKVILRSGPCSGTPTSSSRHMTSPNHDYLQALARDRWFTEALQGLGNVAAADTIGVAPSTGTGSPWKPPSRTFRS